MVKLGREKLSSFGFARRTKEHLIFDVLSFSDLFFGLEEPSYLRAMSCSQPRIVVWWGSIKFRDEIRHKWTFMLYSKADNEISSYHIAKWVNPFGSISKGIVCDISVCDFSG